VEEDSQQRGLVIYTILALEIAREHLPTEVDEATGPVSTAAYASAPRPKKECLAYVR
jgi:hypothetical protein